MLAGDWLQCAAWHGVCLYICLFVCLFVLFSLYYLLVAVLPA